MLEKKFILLCDMKQTKPEVIGNANLWCAYTCTQTEWGMKIPYFKMHFDYGDHHFKIKMKWYPYPTIIDSLMKAANLDYDKAVWVFEMVFKTIADNAQDKNYMWRVFVSKKKIISS